MAEGRLRFAFAGADAGGTAPLKLRKPRVAAQRECASEQSGAGVT